MTTTITPPIKLSRGIWRYDYTGTAPFSVYDYRVYDFTEQNTEDTSYYATSDDDTEPQAIEVFDSTEDSDTAIGLNYPANIVIQWRGYKYADYYDIQKETAPSTWTSVQQYIEDGSGYYKFIGQVESDDVATVNYRVVMYDKAGASVTASAEQLVIRHPSPPELTYTYNAGTGLLTVAAA